MEIPSSVSSQTGPQVVHSASITRRADWWTIDPTEVPEAQIGVLGIGFTEKNSLTNLAREEWTRFRPGRDVRTVPKALCRTPLLFLHHRFVDAVAHCDLARLEPSLGALRPISRISSLSLVNLVVECTSSIWVAAAVEVGRFSQLCIRSCKNFLTRLRKIVRTRIAKVMTMGAAHTTGPMSCRPNCWLEYRRNFHLLACPRPELRNHGSGQSTILTPEFHIEQAIYTAKHNAAFQ